MNDDLQLQRYLDGRLDHDELASFQQRLRDEPSLREELRSIAEQAVAFGDMARRETSASVPSATKADQSHWLALAASITILAASAGLFISSHSSPVLTLLESSGTVSWSSGVAIQTGEKLPAGTLETIGEASSAQLQFSDGTLITLHGESELTFAEEGQKVLTLARGTLSAEVSPQPAGCPMLVRTPSAVAEVVGTVFDLTARAEDTLLKVDEGLVKLKRLADGSQVDVTARRSAVASLLTDLKLDASSTPEPLTSWSFDFTTQTPPREWRGIARDGRMNASPYIAGKKADGSIITLHGVSVRTSLLEQPVRLLATESSVIRYRLRVQKPVGLHIMLITHQPDGGFGGNFETHISPDELHPDAEGWCELSIPVSRCRLPDKLQHLLRRHPAASGNLITCTIINATSASHHLAVSRFELSGRP